MRLTKIKSAVAILVAISLAGCAVSQSDVNHAYDASQRRSNARRWATGRGGSHVRSLKKCRPRSSATGLVPVAYEATLPAMFRERRVVFPGNLPLSKIATLVSRRPAIRCI